MLVAMLRARFIVAAAATTAIACTRPPEPYHCPELVEGELVITEIRGPQAGTSGQWIELHNASGGDIDLFGVRVTFVPVSGAADRLTLVRTTPVDVPADAYVVLGITPTPDVDYAFRTDFEDCTDDGTSVTCSTADLPSSARIEVEACNVLTDAVVYHGLPTLGTYAFDGAMQPDAEANDDQTRWCNDVSEPMPMTATGLVGTPGEANPPCP